MYKNISIGTDDFKEIVESNSLFIDKTLFIKDIIDNTDKVILFPRPRRFGKTLNMSMLSYYFDITIDSKKLFKGLEITKCGKKYLSEMNKYPVIYITLKNCKKNTYEEFIAHFKTLILDLYSKYKFVLKSSKIEKGYKDYFNRCLEKTENMELSSSISNLSKMLEIYYGEKVIVLLDEYDAPILNSQINGYYDECINFMKEVFSSTFKNNLSLKKGIITGILRVSKEGLLSGANNIKIYNITDTRFSNSFGFTEIEVKELLRLYDVENKYKDVKKWYDGYLFEKETIYNPWSILNFLSDENHELKPYWVNTGGVDLLKELIYKSDKVSMLEEYHKLLENGYIEHISLDLYMDLKNLDTSANTIWTLFMLAGYLTPTKYFGTEEDITLKIPNLEIKKNLEKICINWFESNIGRNVEFEKCLLYNKMDRFKVMFQDIVLKSFSYVDTDIDEGEGFYHAYCMGLLYGNSNNFNIKSNRESGLGRFDLVLTPKNNSCKYAYIIEFKVIENNSFDKTISESFKQIEDKKYDMEFKDIYDVTKIAIVFRGKELKIETRK